MGFGMGFCCCGGGFVLLVATHGRYDTGGGVYATVTAWDGTDDGSAPGSALWIYDLGQTGAGNNWVPGHPKIDADGNVYVPYYGKTGATDYNGGLIKLDVNGNLLWNYASGVYTTASAVAGGFPNVANCQIMSNGNIVFSHFLTNSGGYFMTIVDPSGSMVTQIVPPTAGTVGVTVDGGTFSPASCLDLDSADNIYWNITSNAPNLAKSDSSGTYITRASVGGGGASQSMVVIDRVTDKIMGFSRTFATTSSKAVQQVDAATMAEDWNLTLAQVSGTAAAAQSTGSSFTPALSPDGLHCYQGIIARTSGNVDIVNILDVKSNVVAASKGLHTSYLSALLGPVGCACDPITGDTFAYASAGNVNRVLKFGDNGFGTLIDFWQFFNPASGASAVNGLTARTV